MSPDELVAALRTGIAAIETGATVTGALEMTQFNGVHPPSGTWTMTVPITLTIEVP